MDSDIKDTKKPTCLADLWNPETDTYYDIVDEATGAIAFRKDHPTYINHRAALVGIGIYYDAIKTETELQEIETKYICHH
jgi:hypothetical protein